MKTVYLDSSEPLEWIEIRVTLLEKFKECPHKYYFDHEISSKEKMEIFEYGKQVHCYLQALSKSPEWWQAILNEYLKTWECKRIWELIEYWKLFMQYAKKPDVDVLWIEKPMTVCFVINWYNVFLTWTADLIWSNAVLRDFKTSKWERKEDDINFKLQCWIYMYMYYITTGCDVNSFEYLIFTKHVKPRFQQMWIEFRWADYYKEKLTELLMYYTNCHRNNNRPYKIGLHCRWCPLREFCDWYQASLQK